MRDLQLRDIETVQPPKLEPVRGLKQIKVPPRPASDLDKADAAVRQIGVVVILVLFQGGFQIVKRREKSCRSTAI